MMTEPLIKLRGIVQTYQNKERQDLSTHEIEQLRASLDDLTHTILWGVAERFALGTRPNLIKEVQLQLTFYADALTTLDRKPEEQRLPGNSSLPVLEHIFSLLDHLKTYYSEDFDLHARLPDHYCAFKSLGNQVKIQDCVVLMKKHRIDHPFVDLLENFLSAGSNSDFFQIKTWQQRNLQQQLMDRLLILLDHSQENPTLEILKTLVSLEINSIQIYSYFLKYQEQLTSVDQPFSDKLDQLRLLVKIFKQMGPESGNFYDLHAPSLKTSILESLSAEIAYVEQQEQNARQDIQPISPTGVSRFYFKVAITLADLMFFFRVALEVKLISTKFNTHLYEFVSNHIQTQRAEKFSMQSMRNHYNNKPFPDKVVRVVRGWLVKMIDHIDLFYK